MWCCCLFAALAVVNAVFPEVQLAACTFQEACSHCRGLAVGRDATGAFNWDSELNFRSLSPSPSPHLLAYEPIVGQGLEFLTISNRRLSRRECLPSSQCWSMRACAPAPIFWSWPRPLGKRTWPLNWSKRS